MRCSTATSHFCACCLGDVYKMIVVGLIKQGSFHLFSYDLVLCNDWILWLRRHFDFFFFFFFLFLNLFFLDAHWNVNVYQLNRVVP